jgi:hypothetical protein
MDYHLSYQDVKELARTGMEHNFLPGKSLWAAPDGFTSPAAACKGQPLGGEKPSPACKSLLEAAKKPPRSRNWNGGSGSSRRSSELCDSNARLLHW